MLYSEILAKLACESQIIYIYNQLSLDYMIYVHHVVYFNQPLDWWRFKNQPVWAQILVRMLMDV